MTDASLSVDDRLAIHELLARYNHAVDRGDAAAYIATFVETGTLRIGAAYSFEGVEALASVANSPQRVQGQHVTVNVVIDPAGPDRATVRSYAHMLSLAGDPPRPAMTSIGRFDDEVVKQSGHWLFVSRTYNVET